MKFRKATKKEKGAVTLGEKDILDAVEYFLRNKHNLVPASNSWIKVNINPVRPRGGRVQVGVELYGRADQQGH